jgi:zinc transport system substrate-binding protein
MDTHLWLAPENARVIVDAVAGQLAALDASHADHYRANASKMKKHISALEADINKQLEPMRERPYIVFHDAYHYFEDAFSMHPAGAISVSPDRRPGAHRLSEIRRVIRERGAVCVFSEPQFRPATVRVVMEGTGARAGVLDPLGATLTPGKGLWFKLMRGLAQNLETCLKQ